MTWQDDLKREEARLRNIEIERQTGLKRVEDNLTLVDEWLSELERTRATIGEAKYSKNIV